MKSILMAIIVGLFVTPTWSCTEEGGAGFLPENNLKISVNDKFRNDMTEAQFNKIIDDVEEVYAPIVKEKGGILNFKRNWNNNTVNASAQRLWKYWRVNMFGGLARHQLVTDDAFAMVVCHEMGHHLAGAPKVSGFSNAWASNEGQSDYWGAMKCFRRVYQNDDNIEIVAKLEVPELVKRNCEASFQGQNEIALCMRSSLAGQSLANLLGSLRNSGSTTRFDTPDTSVTSSTNDRHPKAQCRLDTYFQGSLCDRLVTDDVDDTDSSVGVCSRSRADERGLRPLCWFKPEV